MVAAIPDMAQGVNTEAIVMAVMGIRSQCDTILAMLEAGGVRLNACPHTNREPIPGSTMGHVRYRCKDCGEEFEG